MIRTGQSFTVSDRLRWNDKDGTYTVLEQKGTGQAPFRLGNDSEQGLVFTFTDADDSGAVVEGVRSGSEAPANEWFHLAGTYDAAAKTAVLYLNGTQIGTAQLTSSAWNADAPMRLGASMLGAVDEVEVYQRALSSADVSDLYARSVTVAAPQSLRPGQTNTAKAATTADIPVYNFDYEHIDLQDCKDTTFIEKHKTARIQEKPYLSCWSAYLYVQDFEEDPITRTLRKAASSGNIVKQLIKEFGSAIFDDDDRFRFRATWVIHSYLGDSTGNNIVRPAGDLKPQDMKVFVRLDEMAVEDSSGRVKLSSAELRGLDIGLQMQAFPDSIWGKECKVRSGTEQTKDVSEWYTKPDSEFIIRAMTPDDPTKNNWCTILPQVYIFDDVLFPTRFNLWSRIVKDENGDDRGVRRKGDTLTDGLQDTAPTFRCDWKRFGFQKADVHIGGCVNYAASRVFAMSKSKDTRFPEVTKHIEEALDPKTNAATFPPLRDGHDWGEPSYPPAKNPTNGKSKEIPGNWADPESDPLVRTASEAETAQNRRYFSNRELMLDSGTSAKWFWPQTFGTNYCKYYMPDKYLPPWQTGGIPRGNGNSCDEYPFASTVQGAAQAEGHFSVRAVNHQQNIDHGHVLRSFYAHYRIGADNQFWVSIEP
ncbi:LamG-like jellyroll fold domain-containing protein [Streptosporangium sp. CA-115845]|uniref:LamG-like jellyroll fold domain-containing protein n=1 Tax=Streptosporangium sp. CA-115845 TaxID=3240071 RepID=UPI003D8F17AF